MMATGTMKASSEVIQPLVSRHAQDAAFYWQQSRSSLTSARVTFEKLTSFHSLLDANLEGLRVAGSVGVHTALKELKRWRSQGEAFVYGVLAIERYWDEDQEVPWDLFAQHADATLDGLSAALVWAHRDAVFARFEAWKWFDHPVAVSIALRARSLLALPVTREEISRYVEHESPWVREAACGLARRLDRRSSSDLLKGALADDSMDVRECAALGLIDLGLAEDIQPVLLQILQQRQQSHETLRGLSRKVSQERADLLARYLGHVVPCGDSTFPAMLDSLPKHLCIPLIAHHGDCAYVPSLLELALDRTLSADVFVAMHVITGIDLSESDFPTAREDVPDLKADMQHEAGDSGSSVLDAVRIREWWLAHRSHYPEALRLLAGAPIRDVGSLLTLLRSGTQIQRFGAALNFTALKPNEFSFDVLAPVWVQRENLRRLM